MKYNFRQHLTEEKKTARISGQSPDCSVCTLRPFKVF